MILAGIVIHRCGAAGRRVVVKIPQFVLIVNPGPAFLGKTPDRQ
jgi:hypothetical protein